MATFTVPGVLGGVPVLGRTAEQGGVEVWGERLAGLETLRGLHHLLEGCTHRTGYVGTRARLEIKCSNPVRA